MEKKEFKLGSYSRETIKAVAHQVGDILGKTLGPAGRNYFLPTGITNDGATIMEHIRFGNEADDQASLAFHEIARQADKDGGDGTTTAMVVGAELVQNLLEKVSDLDTPVPGEIPSMELARMIEEEKNKALEILQTKALPVTTLEQLEQVAFTAMEDKEAAKIIASACFEAGKDSYPIMEEGFNGKIEKDILKGVKYPAGIAHSSMFNILNRAEHENVHIAVVNHAFEDFAEIAPLLQSLIQDPNNKGIATLLIVGKNFSVPFISKVAESNTKMAALAVAKNLTPFRIVLASNDQFHNDTFEDIAAYVDARFVDTHPKTGKKITQVISADCGFAKKIIVTHKEVALIGGRGVDAFTLKANGAITRVGERVEQITKQRETEKDAKERAHMDKRIAALLGGIATIYVDAKTAAERYYTKLKVQDAMNSCRSALNGGMVVGGGVTYKEIAEELGADSLLYKALMKPYDRMKQNNMGQELDVTGVYDAYLVSKSSLENAVSVVKTLITIEGIIADKEHSMVEELKTQLVTE